MHAGSVASEEAVGPAGQSTGSQSPVKLVTSMPEKAVGAPHEGSVSKSIIAGGVCRWMIWSFEFADA